MAVCSLLQQRTMIGAGAAFSGSLEGYVSGGVDIFIASITAEASITVAQPSITGFAMWSPAMATYGTGIEPSCYATTLNVQGLQVQISYTKS
ncbi:hypothetical protein TSOC_012735, partial [Tetrabaena socialis]